MTNLTESERARQWFRKQHRQRFGDSHNSCEVHCNWSNEEVAEFTSSENASLREELEQAHKLLDDSFSEGHSENSCATCREHSVGYRLARLDELVRAKLAEAEWRIQEGKTLVEAGQVALEVIAAIIISGPHPELCMEIKYALRNANDKLLAALPTPEPPKGGKA